uniref:D-aspartate oxidase n=1 Tax=Takifugu rubripes TaxID=31033 RepID=A0A674NJ14_TAKRU
MTRVRVGVVGAGVVGLSTAVCIAEALPFCSVTVLAEKFSPDTTSDGAAGILFANSFPDIPLERQRRWFKDSLDHLLSIAQSEQASELNVAGKRLLHEKKPFWSDLVIGFQLLTQDELGQLFPDHKFGQAFTTVKCECVPYLPWLEKRFRKVRSLQELSHSYDVIVNCSGLGSKTLVGDDGMYPIRGQVLKMEAPWLKNFIRDGDGKTYIYPGIHSATVGGTRQEEDWRLEVDEGDREDMLARCIRLEPSLCKAKVLREWVGLRPGRKNPRVERDLVQLQGRQVPVVHNYGHGGSGVGIAWGTSMDALGYYQECGLLIQVQFINKVHTIQKNRRIDMLKLM